MIFEKSVIGKIVLACASTAPTVLGLISFWWWGGRMEALRIHGNLGPSTTQEPVRAALAMPQSILEFKPTASLMLPRQETKLGASRLSHISSW